MDKIKIGEMFLKCPICNGYDFEHNEINLKLTNYTGWDNRKEGYKEETRHMFTCECGWTGIFENKYNHDLNKMNIDI